MPSRPRTPAALLTILAAAGWGGAAHAGEPVIEVIYTKIPTHPTSIIPGALDLSGQPVETHFRALEQLILSPDGSRWAIIGRTQLGSDAETIMLMGSGNSGTMFAQEGQPVPGSSDPAEVIDFFNTIGRFDEANRFAFSLRARGGSSAVFQKVVLWDGANFSIPFHMGSLLTGLLDTTVSGDELFGNSVGSIHLLNDGRIGCQDSTIQNIHTSRRPAIFYDTAAFMQTNVTVVADLPGTGSVMMDGFNGNAFYTTPDGANYVAQGSIVGDATMDDVLINEGRVVIQENNPIAPGHPAIVHSIVTSFITPGGDWYARGLIRPSGTGVWALRNGQPLAVTGDSITPGSGEHWAGSFIALAANDQGDWILIGTTDIGDPARDTVAVLNGELIVAREGDPVDLNGNGDSTDDDAFIGRANNTLSAFEPDDAAITNDRVLYFFANLRDGAGNDLNSDPVFGSPQAFLRLNLGGGQPPCPADWNGDNTVNSSDISAYLTAWLDSVQNGNLIADFNSDNAVNSTDISAFLTAWLQAVQQGC